MVLVADDGVDDHRPQRLGEVVTHVGQQQQERPSQPAPVENQVLNLVRQELAAFQARFSVLEGIVLRPPLAANKAPPAPRVVTYAAAAAAASGPGQSSRPSGRAASAPPKPAPAQGMANNDSTSVEKWDLQTWNGNSEPATPSSEI